MMRAPERSFCESMRTTSALLVEKVIDRMRRPPSIGNTISAASTTLSSSGNPKSVDTPEFSARPARPSIAASLNLANRSLFGARWAATIGGSHASAAMTTKARRARRHDEIRVLRISSCLAVCFDCAEGRATECGLLRLCGSASKTERSGLIGQQCFPPAIRGLEHFID